jgi:hypothetical protein
MQDNTESEKPEDFSEHEEHTPETEETVPPENLESVESDPEFEEQEGEFLPPAEKKKSGALKVFLFLILVLAGSGSYLYFNNLIPPEILNLVYPKSAPSKPPALITQTPPFMEEVAEVPVPAEIVEAPVTEPVTAALPEILETHISGNDAEPIQPAHISGSDFDQTVKEEETLPETASLEEVQPEVTVEGEPREVEDLEEAEPIVAQEVVEEIEFFREPVAETVTPPEPASPVPEGPQRSKAAQAYLDFIESSVQKLGQLIGEGFNWCWENLKGKLS